MQKTNKKGQMTIFIILGIIILLSSILIWSYYNLQLKELENQVLEYPKDRTIEEYIRFCLKEAVDTTIKEIAPRGGTFTNVDSILYYGTDYNYYCKYETGSGCVNNLITRTEMEEEINFIVREGMRGCSLRPFIEQGYDIEDGNIRVKTTIGTDDTSVDLYYSITASKGDSFQQFNEFYYRSDLKLGKLYDLAVKITNDEIGNLGFDEDSWMRNYSEIKIYKHKPYPDTIYSLNIDTKSEEHNLSFNFAINGKDISDDITLSLETDELKGYCYLDRDKNCYYNVDEQNCIDKGGIYSGSMTFDCDGISTFTYKTPGSDCEDLLDGESRCVYDGVAGAGFDPVGSRHFKKGCYDGEIFFTECADYRQELCTEYEDKKAVCRVNRWQDCAKQTSAGSCTDEEYRDCYWSDYLVKATPFRTLDYDYSNRKCFPEVPPGFKFWEGKGSQVCALANEQNDCHDVHCSLNWVDSTAIYCYFMGDCGDYFNYQKTLSMKGFYNTDGIDNGKPRPYVFTAPMLRFEEYVLVEPDKKNQDLIGNEFEFPQGTQSYMKSKEDQYKKRMDSLTPDISIAPPKVEIDIDSFNSAYCSFWTGDYDVSDCGSCLEANKPCSEYRCKSISANCRYTENNGIGVCYYESINENINLEVQGTYVIKRDIIPTDALNDPTNAILHELDLTEDYFQDWDGYNIGSIEPYDKILVIVNSDTPVNCKISELPNNDRNAKGFVSDKFGTSIPIIFDAALIIQKREDSTLNHNIGSDLDILLTGDNVQDQINEIIQEISSFDTDQQEEMDNVITDYGLDFGGGNNPLSFLNDQNDIYDDDLADYNEQHVNHNEDIIFSRLSNIAHQLISCVDVTGQIEQQFFISYSLEEDSLAPILLKEEPVSGTPLDSVYWMKLWFNEPVVCRYDYDDLEFDNMSNKFECQKTPSDLLYPCYGSKPDNSPVHIKCIDQPFTIEKYYLNLEMNNSFDPSINDSEFEEIILDLEGISWFHDGTLLITDPQVLKNPDKTVYAPIGTTTFKIEFPKEKVCKLAEIGERFEAAENELGCSSDKTCSTSLPLGNHDLLCKNKLEVQRHEIFFNLEFE